MKQLFAQAFAHLGLTLEEDKTDFIASVAKGLVEDILKTREVMEDLDAFSRHLEHGIRFDPQFLEEARTAGILLLEHVTPIATLLALEQLELGVMTRHSLTNTPNGQLHRDFLSSCLLVQ